MVEVRRCRAAAHLASSRLASLGGFALVTLVALVAFLRLAPFGGFALVTFCPTARAPSGQASLRSAALLSSLSSLSSLFCASLRSAALLSFLSSFSLLFSPRFARWLCSRLVLFFVFFPIGLIGLIGLIMPIGLIALGVLRERHIGSLGAAARRGSPLRGSSSIVCIPGVRAASGASPPANQGSPLRG